MLLLMTSATKAELAALNHGTRSSVYPNSIWRNGPQTTINTTTNMWHHCGGCVQWQNTTQTNQIDRHEISLVKGQTVPRTIQNILETGQIQLCQFLDESSSSNPPQAHKKRIHNTTHSGGNVKNRTKQRSPCSSSMKCSKSEHLQGCDDLVAVLIIYIPST